MRVLNWFRRNAGRDKKYGDSRFVPVSENDGVLLPEQIKNLKEHLAAVATEIVVLQEPRIDPMLPECELFQMHASAEFTEDPQLAMLHGLGTAHAWIDVCKLRRVLSNCDHVTDYRSLYREFVKHGYVVKRINYIKFQSSVGF